MMGRHRIYAQKDRKLNETDRLKLCELLIKAGYAAKLGKEKQQGKNTYKHFVEYWEDKTE